MSENDNTTSGLEDIKEGYTPSSSNAAPSVENPSGSSSQPPPESNQGASDKK